MKKKIIYILIIVAVSLLLSNIILNKVTKEEEPEVIKDLTLIEIDSLFNLALDEFNLDSNWIKKVHINSNQYDSLKYVYKIELPSDLLPTVVLREMHITFSNFPVNLISDEKVVNGYTTLNFLTKDELKLQASFSINEKLRRKHSEFAILVSGINTLSAPERQNLLLSSIEYSPLLHPSSNSDSLISQIDQNEKTYSVLISDQISDESLRLNPTQSKNRMEEIIRHINWNYSEAQLFVVDSDSEIFNSASFNFIKDEFDKRGNILHALDEFIIIPSNFEEASSRLDFYLESKKGKEGSVMIISAGNFLLLEDVLLDAKKKGAKFITPQKLHSQSKK